MFNEEERKFGEPELLSNLTDDVLLNLADVIENIFPKYQRRRSHRSIFKQTILYRKTLRLSAEGLHYTKIAKELELPNSTPYFWLSGRTTPFKCFKIPTPNFDFGYLIGSGIGDGWADSNGRQVQYAWLMDEDFADAIVNSGRRLGIYAHKWQNRGWQVVVANVIISELVMIGKKKPQQLLPILSINEDVARGTLTGWFDADGKAGSFNPKGYKYDAPRGTSNNKEIINLMAQLLNFLNIHYTTGEEYNDEFISPKTGKTYRPKSDKTYYVRIRRCCTIRFAKLIGFRTKRKQEKLLKLIQESNFKEIC